MYTGEQETQAMKMSLSHVLMKAWRVPVFWVLAFSVLVSLFTGTTSQCFTGNRPLTLSTVSDSPNRLSTDHLSLPTRNINCQWKIIANEGDRIALTVMNIDLIPSYSCSNQSLKIFDGETEYNRNLGIFCGRQRGQILFSSARFMLIKFISSGSLATGGFNLSYTKAVDSACLTGTRPTRLTGSSSYFTDLRFPSSGIYYSNNAYCDWLISVSNGYIVQLRVNSVNMETVSGCTRDRLDIYDGTSVYSRSLARICSYYYHTVYSTGTNMLIHFTSDLSITGTGFSVSYKAVLKTSVTTTTAYTYHGGYSGYSGPSTLTIVLLVIGAFLETAVFCFVFYQCRRCKSSRSQTSRSNTAVATRDNVSSRNQRTQIASQNRHDVCTLPTALPTTTAPVSTNCATAQCSSVNRPLILSSVNESTNILSTDHLYLPTRNINCEWKIITNEGDRIALTVMNIDLIYSYNCLSQNITIYDGETAYNRNLGIFCGRERDQTLFSSARYMLIKFISIGSLATGGFNLSYRKAPVDPACSTGTRPTRLTENTSYFRELKFPVYGTDYPNNALCDWLISVPSEYVVFLMVDSVNMEASNNCTKDRVDINDGSTAYSPLLARFCNHTQLYVYSTGTNMFIRFTSKVFVAGTGFGVSYNAVLASSVKTTVEPRYDDDHTSQSTPSTLVVIGGVTGAFMVLGFISGLVSVCREKSSESTTRRSSFVAVFIAFRARRREMQ